MRERIVTARSLSPKWRLVIAVVLLIMPRVASAGITSGPLMATRSYGDDIHTSVAPALVAIQGSNANTENQSGGLINVGDAAFVAANPTDGSGLSGQGWTFNWATMATQRAVTATMNGTYYAWVVSVPTNIMAGGSTYNDPRSAAFIARFGASNMNEDAGALLNITANYFVPADTATDTYTLHWVQALTGQSYGMRTATRLDNPFAAGRSPFYDAGGAAGTVAGNPNAYFLDIPSVFENEYEMNPVTVRTFQFALALDDQTKDRNGITQNGVTLLGGYEWGYTYTAIETSPEPATLWHVLSLSLVGIIGHMRQRFRSARGKSGSTQPG